MSLVRLLSIAFLFYLLLMLLKGSPSSVLSDALEFGVGVYTSE